MQAEQPVQRSLSMVMPQRYGESGFASFCISYAKGGPSAWCPSYWSASGTGAEWPFSFTRATADTAGTRPRSCWLSVHWERGMRLNAPVRLSFARVVRKARDPASSETAGSTDRMFTPRATPGAPSFSIEA